MAKIESEHWEKKANGWIFLSHSSRDYEDVKIVRNYLEENGFSALMFYLKCLEKPEKKNLIKPLIKDEIESRNIFVSCKSEASKKSSWFRWENYLVYKLKNKIVKTIDIDTLKYKRATALSILDDLINFATLYFIYHSNDNSRVEKIYKELNLKGFKILKNNPKETSLKDEKMKSFNSAIESVSEQGTVFIFLSKHVLKSEWFWSEKDMILNTKNKNFIIPILLDDVKIEKFPAFVNSRYKINYKDFEFNLMIDEICKKIDEVRNNKEQLN
jgi:hypothetical protein